MPLNQSRLFVGNLSFGTTAKSLGNKFETVGTVTEAIILSRGNRSMGFGFVTMENPQQAATAQAKLNNTELDGRTIRVELSRAERRQGPPQRGPRPGPRARNNGPRQPRPEGRRSPRPAGGRRPFPNRRRRVTQPTPVTTNRLHIGNISYRTSASELGKKFEEFGKVEEAIIVQRNNRSLGFGFVTMSTLEEAKKAQEALNNQEFAGRKILVDGALPNKRSNPSETRIHVGNIPFSLKDEEFAAFFKEFNPKETLIIRSKFTGRSRGYGFVELKTAEEQKKLIEAHPTMEMNQRTVYLKPAYSRPEPQQPAEEKKN